MLYGSAATTSVTNELLLIYPLTIYKGSLVSSTLITRTVTKLSIISTICKPMSMK